MEYLTTYPKTVSFIRWDKAQNPCRQDRRSGATTHCCQKKF